MFASNNFIKFNTYDVQLKNGATIVVIADTMTNYGDVIQFLFEGRPVALLVTANTCSIQLRMDAEKPPKGESKVGYLKCP